jgi:hypothetical protein
LTQNLFDIAKYIYQHENWTNFTWDYSKIAVVLGEVRNLQGKLLGTMNALGFSLKSEAGGLGFIDRNVDGVVEMLLDATQNFTQKKLLLPIYGLYQFVTNSFPSFFRRCFIQVPLMDGFHDRISRSIAAQCRDQTFFKSSTNPLNRSKISMISPTPLIGVYLAGALYYPMSGLVFW